MKQSLTSSFMATAVLILLGTAVPAQGQDQTRGLEPQFDQAHRRVLAAMRHEAPRAGVEIDTDIDVIMTARVNVVFATVDGFEELDFEEDASANFGFLYLRGFSEVPDGFYALQFDTGRDGAFARLIDARGEQFRVPAVSGDDPTPERGPRKGLTTEGGRFVEAVIHDVNQQLHTLIFDASPAG